MAKKRVVRPLEDRIGPDAKRSMEKSKIFVKPKMGPKGKRYTKDNPKHVQYFSEGHDLLQYNMVVRPFIKKKYNVDRDEYLDILFYLYPIQFFTKKDYSVLPITEYHSIFTINHLLEEGYIKKVVQTVKNTASIYTLSDMSHRIVEDYYDFLSGRKTITPDNYATNPFRGAGSAKIDKVREKLLEKLKHQAENYPSLFRKNLFV
jgi:hypothetical protein